MSKREHTCNKQWGMTCRCDLNYCTCFALTSHIRDASYIPGMKCMLLIFHRFQIFCDDGGTEISGKFEIESVDSQPIR